MFYLAVALVWLTLGLILIIYPEWMPPGLHRIPGTEISFGWVCIFFFAWRMLGWWQWRAKQHRRVLEQTPPARRARAADAHHDEYYPEFDFNEPPGADQEAR